jgi:hypothetical protein
VNRFALTCAFAIVVLAGCGGGEPSSDTPKPEPKKKESSALSAPVDNIQQQINTRDALKQDVRDAVKTREDASKAIQKK